MATLTDAALVERILDGDAEALTVLYDRFADRIHTMCAHLLRDRDEAADVTAEVLLTAVERIGQLRDPDKLRPWLYAIARNEVYRRSRQRRRVTPLADPDAGGARRVGAEPAGLDLRDHLVDDPDGFDHVATARLDGGADEVGLESGADPEELAALLQEASAGLDDRDRMVLELHLAQGLDGQDLADALGVTVDHGYQLVHRMKERLERSMAALLVVRGGRELCDGLDEAADRWDGTYSVLWRKRFARHVDRCERCSTLRTRLPKAVLAGTALSVAAQSAVLASPVSARERFLVEAPTRVGVPRGRPWRGDGFPPAPRRRWPWAAAVVAVLLVLGAGSLVIDEDPQVVRAAESAVTTTTEARTPTTVATTTVVPVGEELSSEEATTTTRPRTTTTTRVPATTRAPATTAAPPPSTSTTTTTTTTTTTAPPSPPSISLSGPGCTNWGSSATLTASVSAPAGVSSVTLSWSGSASGSGSMSGGGSSYSRSVAVSSPMTSLSFTATVIDARGRSASSSRSMTAGPACSG